MGAAASASQMWHAYAGMCGDVNLYLNDAEDRSTAEIEVGWHCSNTHVMDICVYLFQQRHSDQDLDKCVISILLPGLHFPCKVGERCDHRDDFCP